MCCVNNEAVFINFIKSKCLPIVTYAIEAFPINTTQGKELDRVVYKAIAKVFKTYDVKIITEIKSIFKFEGIYEIACKQHCKFLSILRLKQFDYVHVVCSVVLFVE